MPGTSHRARTTIRQVVDPADPAAQSAYALLERSFDRSELVDYRDWTGSLLEQATELPTDFAWHLIVAEQRGAVVGLSSGTYLGNVNLGVIGYLAADPQVRAHGVGTRLRNRLRRQFARDAERLMQRPLAGIIGEVSVNNPWLRTLATQPEVLVLDFPYFQPPLADDDDPTPFILYYESLLGPRARLPTSELRRILYTVWRRIYRIARPLDRPVFRTMLESLAHRRTVGRLKLLPLTRDDH